MMASLTVRPVRPSAVLRSAAVSSDSASGPRAAMSGRARRSSHVVAMRRPKRRESTKQTVAPLSRTKVARVKRGSSTPRAARTIFPVMPR